MAATYPITAAYLAGQRAKSVASGLVEAPASARRPNAINPPLISQAYPT